MRFLTLESLFIHLQMKEMEYSVFSDSSKASFYNSGSKKKVKHKTHRAQTHFKMQAFSQRQGDNLSRNKVTALKELKNNSALNLKKTDKGTTTVILSKTKKIKEAKVQLDSRVVEHRQVCLRFLDNTDDRPQNTCVSSDNLDCFS